MGAQKGLETVPLSCEWLSLDYSVAPYTKYPVQHKETIEGYHKLASTSNRTISLGDSAGGTLAIALVMKFRVSETPEPFSVAWSLHDFIVPSYKDTFGPSKCQNDWATAYFVTQVLSAIPSPIYSL